MELADRHDDFFGLLKWDTENDEWTGSFTLAWQGEVEVTLPPEYVDLPEIQAHIQAMMKLIDRDELSFRERAAGELFARGSYRLYLNEDETFQQDVFVAEMHIGTICFEFDDAPSQIMLWYEYAEGREHGIIIHLTWQGNYIDVR